MTSAFGRCPSSLLASLPTPNAEQQFLPALPGWLDLILSVTACFTIIVVLLLPNRRRRWINPAGGLLPAHRLREESIIIAVIVYLTAAACATTAAGWIANDALVAQVMAGVVAQVLGIAVCAVIARRAFDGGAGALLRGPADQPFRARRAGMVILATWLSIGLCQFGLFATVLTIRLVAPDVTFEAHRTIQALRTENVTIAMRAVLWISAGLLAPLAEELFFRGLIQNYLLSVLGSRWRAVLATSCVFALVHIPQPETVPALFVLGIVLGVAYGRTGALIVPIAVHALFNLRTLLWEAVGAFTGS